MRDYCLIKKKPLGYKTGPKSALTQTAPRKMLKKWRLFWQTGDFFGVLESSREVFGVLNSWNAGLSVGTKVNFRWRRVHSAKMALTQTAPRKSTKKVKKGPFCVVFCCYLVNETTLCVSKYTVMCALTRCILAISSQRSTLSHCREKCADPNSSKKKMSKTLITQRLRN